MEILALIPARGGSKRVKKKNIKYLNGKPLIQYTIEAALSVEKISRIIVSTDDQEIASISIKCGAEVPFLRPKEMAKDDTPDQPVFKHALKALYGNEKYIPDIILNLRPTSPFKKPITIDKVINKIIKNKADIVRTISRVEGVNHPYWMYKSLNSGLLKAYDEKIKIKKYFQSQLLPDVYKINGLVDAYLYSTIMRGNMLDSNNIYGLVTEDEESIDIDTEFDFKICEALINQKG